MNFMYPVQRFTFNLAHMPLQPPQQAGQEEEITICFIFAKQDTVHIVELQT